MRDREKERKKEREREKKIIGRIRIIIEIRIILRKNMKNDIQQYIKNCVVTVI